MKGFKLDSNGDVVIKENQIVMVGEKELLRQSIQQVLGTNKGEWSLNKEEGVNFYNILGKHGSQTTEIKEDAALKALYNNEINKIKDADTELASKLQNRLEGLD